MTFEILNFRYKKTSSFEAFYNLNSLENSAELISHEDILHG